MTSKIVILRSLGILGACFALFCSCSEINDSWEVKGGGFIKYSLNGGDDRTIELEDDDVEIPYIRNHHHYLLITTQAKESDFGDQFNIMVNRPVLGENHPVEGYSWFVKEFSERGFLDVDSSIVHLDQKDDSTWTANLDLYARDCRSDNCSDTLPRIHITGRFRYWIPEEER